jgi:hypothetical protein
MNATTDLLITRDGLIEAAYYRDDTCGNEIVAIDEQLCGVRPKTAPVEDLESQLTFWLILASQRWV